MECLPARREGCESYRYPPAQTSLVELHPWNSQEKCRRYRGDWWVRIYCTAPHLHRRSDFISQQPVTTSDYDSVRRAIENPKTRSKQMSDTILLQAQQQALIIHSHTYKVKVTMLAG